jgi:hypothetical protein
MRHLLPLICLLLASAASLPAQVAPLVACTQVKGETRCDDASFSAALKAAKTVAVSSQPASPASDHALERLAHDLGKTVSPDAADLSFELVRQEQGGIFYGPGDRELATLRIYAHGTRGERGPLVWVETYLGQPDMPWPSVAQQALQQFKSEFKN